MDALGRYYTDNTISNLLIRNLETQNPKKILDLGVGDASLSIAAHSRWKKAKYFATEIEKSKVNAIGKRLSFLKVYNYNTLNPNVSAKLKIKFGSIDIAICNPPYIPVKKKKKYIDLFKSAGCSSFNNLKKITSEIVFFVHNLKLLKNNGELGIIVSDSLITGKDFEIFRNTILGKFNVRRIIQLPDNIFNKTEARTHIIFISKSDPKNSSCDLFFAQPNGKLSKRIKVSKQELSQRMDYQFYNSIKRDTKQLTTLKDIGTLIKRGKYSYKDLRSKRTAYFHSINFKGNDGILKFKETNSPKYNKYFANKDDILMCRVGKRSVGKVALLHSGNILISDCIYKISVPKKYLNKVFGSLRSKKGQSWLKAYAHGVCSQVISKSDLEKFPIF